MSTLQDEEMLLEAKGITDIKFSNHGGMEKLLAQIHGIGDGTMTH